MTRREPRVFQPSPAVRGAVPLWFGLSGASGGGKTFSALRMATGMRKVLGGKIGVLDTEADRALHYRDRFEFEHFHFAPPFSPLDYLDGIRQLNRAGCSVIVIDSASHAWEGEGGVLEWHDRIVAESVARAKSRPGENRSEWQLEQAYNAKGWIEPKAANRALINGALQLKGAFIWCFRAKDSTKPGGKGEEFQHQGWVPIASSDLVFEMTACCVLEPGAKGRPKWVSDLLGESRVIKTPEFFDSIFEDGRPFDEKHGEQMALWAKGGAGGSGVSESAARMGRAAEREPAGTPPAAAGDPIHAEAVEAVRAAFRAAGITKVPAMTEFAVAAGVAQTRIASCWNAADRRIELDRLSLDELTMIVDHAARQSG